MKARVHDIHNRFLFEGKAVYKKDESLLYVLSKEDVARKGPGFIVQFEDDNHGVIDMRCGYIGFERESLDYNITLEVAEITKTTQRRQDVKAKINLPVKLVLLGEDDAVMIDPETMKSKQIQAFLRDISAGGIMIDSETELAVDQRFLFPFDKGTSPILVTAQVIREQPQENQYHRYGCQYVNNNSGKESVIREYVFRLQLATRNSLARDE